MSWSIWLYKDIGYQGSTFMTESVAVTHLLLGMVYVSPDTTYMRLFKTFLAKKHRMAVDAWGTDDTYVKVNSSTIA